MIAWIRHGDSMPLPQRPVCQRLTYWGAGNSGFVGVRGFGCPGLCPGLWSGALSMLSSHAPTQALALPVVSGAEPTHARSEEHTSELQSLMRISYAVFCLKKKKTH